jgi:hypothetical protein
MRFQLLDGQVLEANARRSGAGWAVDIQGQLFLLPDSVIARTAPAGSPEALAMGAPTTGAAASKRKASTDGAQRADANRTRYFYAPTAFSLGSGNGYVSQKELVFTAAAVGVGDHVDVQLGTVLPTLFIEDGQVGVVGVKLSQALGSKVHVGGGVQAFAFSEGVLAMPFVVGTVGTPDRHASVSVASATGFDQGTSYPVATLLNVSGAWRVREHLALVSENYVMTQGDDQQTFVVVMPSAGVRFLGERFTTDAGFFTPIAEDLGETFLLPWLSVTWNFQRRSGG